MAHRGLAGALLALLAGCTTPASSLAPTLPQDPTAASSVRERYASYTLEQAQQDGYVRDAFCLDAFTFGRAPSSGAMGFHATNESLLRGPIAVDKPQAIMFDAQGRVLGVEYEITTDAVREAPTLFGQTFKKLPPHPGVHHEHYALHVWFVPNSSGQFADFNPQVTCPPGSTPQGPAPQPAAGGAASQSGAPAAPAPTVDPEDHSGAH